MRNGDYKKKFYLYIVIIYETTTIMALKLHFINWHWYTWFYIYIPQNRLLFSCWRKTYVFTQNEYDPAGYLISYIYSLTASVPTENLKLSASFCTWMDAHPNFRTICEEGKGKIRNNDIFKNMLGDDIWVLV